MADYDIVIKRGAIIDGTRIRRYRGDIAVKDGRIVEIGKTSPTAASRALPVDGLMVAPASSICKPSSTRLMSSSGRPGAVFGRAGKRWQLASSVEGFHLPRGQTFTA